MKKLTAILLALSLLVLSGCNGTPNGAGNEVPSSIELYGEVIEVQPGGKLETILSTGKIILGVNPGFAPFEFIDLDKMGQGDEQYAGSDLELARFIAQSLDVDLVIESLSFDGVLAGATEGKIDMAISGISPKPERQEMMDFTQPHYKEEGKHGLLIQASDYDKFKSIDDLNQEGMKIAAQNGSIQQTAVLEQCPNAEAVTISDLSSGVMEVLSGRVDALATAYEPGEGYVLSYPNELAMSEVLLDIPSLGQAIGIQKGNEDLVAALDAIVAHVRENGLYVQWVEEARILSAAQATEE